MSWNKRSKYFRLYRLEKQIMFISLYTDPVTAFRQCIPARPEHLSLVRIPLLKIHFVKFVRSIFLYPLF